MMYPYMTLNDDTEITHSEMYPDGKVKVYIETPDETGGFHDAICWLAFLPFLMELEYRVLWVVVPTVSLLWMTRYIFGDNLDWDKTDKKGWKEGRMNYSQKSNKKNIGR